MLKYLTRDGSSPNGKPWVFFLAAPEDTAETLTQIAEDIFEFCNCAIWYDSPGAPDSPAAPAAPQELEDAMAQCGMAVLPVIPSVLDPNGRVQRLLLPMLQRHPMPLLPILEDPNLLMAFNARFKNKQLLRRHNTDPTSMPYSDRLKRFLDTNLLRDELAEQVKHAFQGCIFLSYRTDDRAMILRLLQQIHQDPHCRRIGIWYDQFLIPGEDFNEGIAQAILDSDLFLLALTHNMVGGESYVTRKEYPLARQASKDILPVLLETVDPALTDHHFPDLPEPADIESAIRDLAGRIKAPASAASSPVLDYLLATAYLYGLNAERNVSIALEFFSESAQQGYAPAALRLATIRRQEQPEEEYQQWKLRWLRKYAELTEADYRKDPCADTVRTYGDALDRLAEALFSPDTKEESFHHSARAAKLLEKHGLLEECAQTCSNYGLRLTQAGLNQDGLRMLLQALTFHAELSKKDPDYAKSHMAQSARYYYNIGIAAVDAEDLSLAKIAFESAAANYGVLYRHAPGQYALPLAESYGNLGSTHSLLWDRTQKPEDYDRAERCQGTALRILNEMVDKDPTVYEPVFARCCVAAAALFSRGSRDGRGKARMFLDLAIPTLQHYEKLYPGTCAEDIAKALANRASIRFLAGDYQAARADYETALPIFRAMPWHAMTLAKTCWNLGNAYAMEKNMTVALEWYAQAVTIYENGTVQGSTTCRDYADCCYNYANLLYEAGAYADALAMVHRTIGLYRGLQAGDPNAYADRIQERQRFAAHLEQLV